MKPQLFFLLLFFCSCGAEKENTAYKFLVGEPCADFPVSYYARLWEIVPDSLDYTQVDSLKEWYKPFSPARKPESVCLDAKQKTQISRLSISSYGKRENCAKVCPFAILYSSKDTSVFFAQSGEACTHPDSVRRLIHFIERNMPGLDVAETLGFFYCMDRYRTAFVHSNKYLGLLGFSKAAISGKRYGFNSPWLLRVWTTERLYRACTPLCDKPPQAPKTTLKRHAFFLLHNAQTGEYLSSSKPIPLDRKAYPNVLDTLDRYF